MHQAKQLQEVKRRRTSDVLKLNAYTGRKLIRDGMSAVWARVMVFMVLGWCALSVVAGWSWLVAAAITMPLTWRTVHSGVWVGTDDVLLVSAWGRRRLVRWSEVDRFEAGRFNQWTLAWLVKHNGERIPCHGISSGRKETLRVDMLVEQLNDILYLETKTLASSAGKVDSQACDNGGQLAQISSQQGPRSSLSPSHASDPTEPG